MTGNFEFSQRPIVIAVTPVEIARAGEVRFASIRPETSGGLNRRLSCRQARPRMIEIEEINAGVGEGQLAIRLKE